MIYKLRHHLFEKKYIEKNLSFEDTVQLEPDLIPHRLKGSTLYDDIAFQTQRYSVELALQAQQFGATIKTHTKVTQLHEQDKHIKSVTVEQTMPYAETATIKCAYVINTTGSWANELPVLLPKSPKPVHSLAKKISLITRKLSKSHGLTLQLPNQSGYMYIIPWGENSLVGCAYTPFDDTPDRLSVSSKDQLFILNALNQALNMSLTEHDIISTVAGLRTHIKKPIVRHAKNGWTLAGNQLAQHRVLSEKMAKILCRHLKLGLFKSITHKLPSYGGDILDDHHAKEDALLDAQLYPISKELYQQIQQRYGSLYQNVLSVICEAQEYRDVLPHSNVVKGEIVYAIRHELAQTIDDIMFRRTTLGFNQDRGEANVYEVAKLFQIECQWTEDEYNKAIRRYLELVSHLNPHAQSLWA